MIKKTFSAIIMILITTSLMMAQDIAVPDGYASYSGTTGGGSATPITVSTASEFNSAVNNNNPAVIIVEGRLNVGDVSIGSNKQSSEQIPCQVFTGGVCGFAGAITFSRT